MYRGVQIVVRFVLSQFFSEVRLAGAPAIETGPLLIIGNHPNFALDSLVIGAVYERDLWFLGKATLFENPLAAALLRKLHVIPVERRQDSPVDSGQNRETFRRAAEIIERAGALALFPEGVSKGERKLAPLKTGAARIAFQAEEAHRFELGLVVQPVGITYSDLQAYRSAVTVTFGKPIVVADFAAAFAADAMEAVRSLTARCQGELEALTVEVKNADHQALVEKIARLYRSTGSTLDERARLGLIAQNVESLAPRYPERAAEIQRRIDEYLEIAAIFALDSGEPLEERFDPFLALVLCPLVLLGALIHVIPYRAIGTVTRKAKDPVVIASYKLGLGIVLFPLWYVLLACAAGMFIGGWWWAFFAVAAALVSGYAANNHLHRVRLFLLSTLWPGRRKPVDVVKIIRDDIIADLERIRTI